MESLLEEAETLTQQGVKEIILVAQDVTKYGIDLYGEKRLVELLQNLSKIEAIEHIRLLYCYPEEIDDRLIEEIKTNNKILKYLDIPLQHVSTSILKSMNRRSDYNSICNLFNKLQNEIPNIVLRTTFIVGFPGETEEDVDMIEIFLKSFKLDNVGFFAYSREEGTKAYDFKNQIDEETKQIRLNRLSQIQYDIVLNKNKKLLDKIVDVVIDECYDTYSIGRYYGQCPQIDSIIYINEPIEIGKKVKLKITNILDYDLEGERL